jgi:thiamine biosynthesis lipoprotein
MDRTTRRRIKVEHLMGTVVSIDLRDPQVDDGALDAAFAWLRRVDERFSPFIASSDISRLGRGEWTLDECHPDVATVLSLCEDLRQATNGVFNAWGWRADGRVDPSGVVKGWAAEHASTILEHAGAANFCINAGGDVIVRGAPEPGRAWRIGIRHPIDGLALAAVLDAHQLAVATSGGYERGDHIVDARSGAPSGSLLSLTVAGPSLTLADAYATAGFAMGSTGVEWVAAQSWYEPYAVTRDGRVRYSDGFASLLAAEKREFSATREAVPLRPR